MPVAAIVLNARLTHTDAGLYDSDTNNDIKSRNAEPKMPNDRCAHAIQERQRTTDRSNSYQTTESAPCL